MIYKKPIYTFLFLLGLFNHSHCSESLLERDIKSLKFEQQGVYEMTETIFTDLFPCEYLVQKVKTVSNLVGQIINDHDEGKATGFIRKIVYEDNQIKIFGITALHSFCRVRTHEQHPLIINKNYKFVLSRKALPKDLNERPYKSFDLGTFSIEKVFTDINLDPNNLFSGIRDVCVFQGSLLNQGGLKRLSPENYVNFLNDIKLEFVQDSLPHYDSQEACIIYHYPDGRKEMRNNKGTLDRQGTYKIRTLEGSSGAPVMVYSSESDSYKVLGVHIGTLKIKKDVLVLQPIKRNRLMSLIDDEYASTHRVARNDLHKFEYITETIYEKILTGLNLYDLNKDDLLILHAKLLCSIVNIHKLSTTIPDVEEFPLGGFSTLSTNAHDLRPREKIKTD